MQSILHLLLIVASAEAVPDTVVVCPTEFREAMEPWLAHRARQGHRIAIVTKFRSADAIRSAIRSAGRGGKLKNVLLVGDTASISENHSGRQFVPTHHARAKVNIQWGSEPEIATDNWYADLDDDQVPDVAIGRLSVDSTNELSTVIQKILAYENGHQNGLWRRRINFVAGVGGFGKVVDSMLEMAAKKFLTEEIPASYQTSMTYGSWQSPYCPDPRMFHRTTINRFNEGCLFWVYIGHGHRWTLDQMRVPGARYHILANDDVEKLRSAQGSPIAIFLACYSGAFDSARDCLAEEMLTQPSGPAAIICGSRVTMPYAMSVMSHEMLSEFFKERRKTLGEVFLNAKRRMVAPVKEQDAHDNRLLLDAIAKAVSPSPKLIDAERAEHLQLFNLLGDPLMRLQHPNEITLSATKSATAGEKFVITGQCELPGRCTVELVCRRDRLRGSTPQRRVYDRSDATLAEYDEVYRRANDTRWLTKTVQTSGSEFSMTLDVPENAFGAGHIRAFVESSDGFAMGSTEVFVRRKRPSN